MCRLSLLMASPMSCRGFFNSFLFFLLLWLDHFKWSIFESLTLFFGLAECATKTLYWTFYFLSLCSAAPWCVTFFFMFLFLCWISHFVLALFFLLSLNCLSVFSYNSLWAFLEHWFWILCQQFMDLNFLKSVTESLLCSLGGIIFSWFFIIPIALLRCLGTWWSNHVFQTFWSNFSKERLSAVVRAQCCVLWLWVWWCGAPCAGACGDFGSRGCGVVSP